MKRLVNMVAASAILVASTMGIACAQSADSVHAGRFASAGAWARTYPSHVAHVVAPLGKDVRTTALGAAAVCGAIALAHTQDEALDQWILDGHTMGSIDDFASNTLPAIMLVAYAVPHIGGAAVEGKVRLTVSRTEALVEAVAAQGLIVEGIKHAVGRRRPNGDRYAFPSGHTSYAFTMAGLADAAWGGKVGIPAYAAATLVGASRISLRRHWLSDVVAGAALGATVGELVGREHKKGEDDPQLAAGWSPDGSIVLGLTVPFDR